MGIEQPLTILIADDTDTDRLILENILGIDGHRVVSATNGLEAIEVFKRERPDIVLLDALMPELDGFGAARQIKGIAGNELVPIIFLTSLTDTDSLVKCLDAGGDDFLSKPYNRVILQAKIKAFARMRDLHATTVHQRDEISRRNKDLIHEQTVAKEIFDNIAHAGCLDHPSIQYYASPLAVFNGDILVAAITPSGNMMVLLGDFTGHGLPAAVGAMPLASTFYGMVQKGFSLQDILYEVNQKLKTILPVGFFCCAAIAEISFSKKKLRFWSGGLPDCFLYRSATEEVELLCSRHLPLGVVGNNEFVVDSTLVELNVGDRLFMWTDGIHEARNDKDEMYGEERLRDIFDRARPEDNIFSTVLNSVHSFIGTQQKDDDISLIELTAAEFEGDQLGMPPLKAGGNKGLIEWGLDFEVRGETLKHFDPLPLLLSILVEVPGLRHYSGSLYCILSELYSNGLEHGVLGLESDLKTTTEGFTQYYQLRAERLGQLSDAYVKFFMTYETLGEGGCLEVRVKDSGEGFDFGHYSQNRHSTVGYSGRGIPLIRSLCDEFEYLQDGSEARVLFKWEADSKF